MTLASAAGESDVFQSSVWPVLESRCVKCHGPEKAKGALRLDSREAAIKGGETGPAIVPGKPAESLLIKLVHNSSDERSMPPKEKLTNAEVKLLEKWIADGALWTKAAAPAAAVLKPGERIGDAWSDPRNPIVKIFQGKRLDLWSFKALAEIKPSAGEHPIDALVRAKTQLGPEASRLALVRRVYLNITGLPPTPDEANAFIADKNADAYEKLIDRLLATPRYGEHWARMWLDAVRYSDSNGFDWDEFRPNAWRFRDYVIRSLNADKPYNQFVREQLAGDEMVPGDPENAQQQDMLIATSYLRLGPWDNSSALFMEQEKNRQNLMNDLVETTGAAMLGLAMSCCKCHDHKNDPLSQEDFYRMKAFFEPLKFRDDLALDLPADQKTIRAHNAKVEAITEGRRQYRTQLLAPGRLRLRSEKMAKLAAESQTLLCSFDPKRDDAAKNKIKEIEKKIDVSDDEVKKAAGEELKKELNGLDEELKKLKKDLRPFTNGILAGDGDVKPTKVFYQGNVADVRQEVSAGFPSILDPNPAAMEKCARPKSTGRRTTLADWIVSPKNPLTARVIVNRIWQGHFATGLVATANDFGLAGARPANAELLDWLAAEFIREGWSMKKLHRLILTSATYRQGTKPGTPPLGHAPRRLSAEQLRDSMLFVSGALKEKNGGPPVWPALPAEVLKANPAFLDDNETKTKGWYPSPADQQNVRGIYLVQKRTVRVCFMETFDLPENSVSCPRRNISTVAPQALTLLNNSFTAECAKAFAARIEKEAGGDTTAQIKRAYQLTLQREPDGAELSACAKYRETRTLTELCRAILNLNEFIYLD